MPKACGWGGGLTERECEHATRGILPPYEGERRPGRECGEMQFDQNTEFGKLQVFHSNVFSGMHTNCMPISISTSPPIWNCRYYSIHVHKPTPAFFGYSGYLNAGLGSFFRKNQTSKKPVCLTASAKNVLPDGGCMIFRFFAIFYLCSPNANWGAKSKEHLSVGGWRARLLGTCVIQMRAFLPKR